MENKTFNEEFSLEQENYYKAKSAGNMEEAKKYLGDIYKTSYNICKFYIDKYCVEHKVFIDKEEKYHDAATWIIFLYYKFPDFQIQKISSYAVFAVKKALFGDRKSDREISLDSLLEGKKHD